MSKFNTYMAGIDADFYIDYAIGKENCVNTKRMNIYRKKGIYFRFAGYLNQV